MRQQKFLALLALGLVVGSALPADARVRRVHAYVERTENGSPISAGDNDVRIDADGQVITTIPPPPPGLATATMPKRQ